MILAQVILDILFTKLIQQHHLQLNFTMFTQLVYINILIGELFVEVLL